ncbi:MAG: YdeI/OmpD-associated family protein [Bacteroidetes bacterium]|nr:YdeI/OmpD-associated family protein [Bacteroidota bacterium]
MNDRLSDSEMEYHFAAPVLRLETGMKQHYVPIPMEMADALKEAGVRRVLATLNGYTLSRGIQGRKDGEKYLMLGRTILRDIGANYGDTVMVSITPDPEPDRIELCDEFASALKQDDEAFTRFETLVPSHRRGLNYYVDSAKRADTRIKRALEVVNKLRTYTLYGDLKKEE